MTIPQANQDVEVKLAIRTKHFGGPGWTRVMADDGVAYGYKYAGGHPNKNGDVQHTTGQGPASVTVVLKDPKTYTISQISFLENEAGQLSNGKLGEIKNLCTQDTEAAYKVEVVDRATGAIILCDPVIRNVPHPK